MGGWADGWMCVWVDGWMNRCTDIYTYFWMSGYKCGDEWVDGWAYGWMGGRLVGWMDEIN